MTADGTVGRGRLWFGLLGGVVAWTAHLMLCYLISEFGCRAGKGTFLGLTGVAWLLLAVTAATFGIAVAAVLSTRPRMLDWFPPPLGEKGQPPDPGRLTPHPNPPPQGGREPEFVLADVGLMVSGFSAFVILVESLPILYYLRDC